jgi:hypothetical protein
MALTSATFSQLVAHRFATPYDVRIESFLENLHERYSMPDDLTEFAACLIRGVLGDESELDLVPVEERTGLRIFLIEVLVAEARLDRVGVDRLLDAAEPMAKLVLESEGDVAHSIPASLSHNRPRRRRRWVLGLVGSVVSILLAVILIVSVLGGRESASDELTEGPPKPESFLEVYTSEYPVGLRGRTLAESDGLFVGPHFAVRIRQVDITDTVDHAIAHYLGEESAFTAAEGHELVLFNVADDSSLEAPWGDSQVDTALVVDGVQRSLDGLPTFRETVVASVPEGAPVLLEVEDAGRRLHFDLRAGRVVTDEESSFSASGSLPGTLYRASAEVAYGSRLQQLRVEILSMGGTADLDAYHPEFGWAKPGRAWLVVGPMVGRSTPSEYDPTFGYFDVAFDLDVRQSLRLEVPGEGSLSPVRTWPRHAKMHEPMSPSEIVALFDVPASFREGRLVITPQGSTATNTSSPTSASGVHPHRDCGQPGIACLSWSEAPPAGTVSIGVSR